MPPTGHAVPQRDVAILREWNQEGAPLPKETIKLNPKGTAPRSPELHKKRAAAYGRPPGDISADA